MKINLKNRPKLSEWGSALIYLKTEKWFEGFEKELRELLTMKYPHEAILKEILGE